MSNTSLLRAFDRVRKDLPCPVCGKSDWCLVARDRDRALCMRVADGRNATWNVEGMEAYLHALSGTYIAPANLVQPKYVPEQPQISTIEWDRIVEEQSQAMNAPTVAKSFEYLAGRLGLSQASLQVLNIGYDATKKAWSFPMRDDRGRVIGIRLRSGGGFKYAVTGSRNGLFMPAWGVGSGEGPVLIPEGPTDTAACIDLGFEAIGRPFCSGAMEMLGRWARRTRPSVVVVSDNDPAGIRGAQTLATELSKFVLSIKIIAPLKGKDIREWKSLGATKEAVQELIAATPRWTRA